MKRRRKRPSQLKKPLRSKMERAQADKEVEEVAEEETEEAVEETEEAVEEAEVSVKERRMMAKIPEREVVRKNGCQSPKLEDSLKPKR